MIVHKYWRKLKSWLLLTITFNLAINVGYADPRFSIVATTSMLGDAIQQIVQDKATVITLMGPGIDPHVYKASPQDVKSLSEANLVFYNGLHLEGKMTDVLRSFSKKKPVYAVSDGIDPTQYLRDPSFAESIDPHIWFDVSLWKQVVNYISTHIQNIDPTYAAYYQANADSYNKKLDELEQMIRKAIQEIPPTQRVLISAHDAFGYFGRAYQIEVKGLQGISTVEECGLRDIANLVAFIIQREIKAIFPESSVIDKPLRAVVQGCQKRGHAVVLGPELYSDALGQADTWAGTYIGMITTNVQNIVNALK